jgi:hypothetical protein
LAILNVHSGPIIVEGSAESNVLALGTDYIVGLICPEDWTPAVVSVLISAQGDNYFDLFDGKGSEFIFNVTPGVAMAVDPYLLLCAAYVRLRSGTRDNPVPQAGERRFHLIGTTKLAMRAEESS